MVRAYLFGGIIFAILCVALWKQAAAGNAIAFAYCAAYMVLATCYFAKSIQRQS